MSVFVCLCMHVYERVSMCMDPGVFLSSSKYLFFVQSIVSMAADLIDSVS